MTTPLTRDEVERALGVSRETGAAFEAWLSLLTAWNRRINLVAASTLEDPWRRHILDSAQIADHVADVVTDDPMVAVDLGAGAGFPGIALALMGRDRGWPLTVRLIESNAKKAAFLREAVRATNAPAEVLNARVEAIEPFYANLVTARAFAPLQRLFESAIRFWNNKNTVGVFLKGRDAAVELTTASKSWRFRQTLSPSRSDPDGQIVRVEELDYDGRPPSTA